MNQGYDYSSFGESRDSIASYTAKPMAGCSLDF